jgi:ATP-dependent DNA helicase PIF1
MTSSSGLGNDNRTHRSHDDDMENVEFTPPKFEEWLLKYEADKKLTLDEEQRRVVTLACKECKNVFYTGSGGVGKSLVTRTIHAYLQEAEPNFEETVAVTASTGIASTHIAGTTIHSALGFGAPKHYSDFQRMWGRKDILRKLRRMLIDEVSMLSGELFDALDEKLRSIRGKKDVAFGGVQLIVCGDFFQLPPIVTNVPEETWPLLLPDDLENNVAAFWQHKLKCPHTLPESCCAGCRKEKVFCARGFAFQSKWWWDADFVFTEFEKVYRQSDVQMVQVLNAIRQGKATAEQVAWLNEQCCAPPAETSRAIQLAPKRLEVKDRNEQEGEQLRQRGASTRIWFARDEAATFEGSSADTNEQSFGHFFFTKDCPADKRVSLEEGARVMLLVNLDLEAKGEEKLVNGTLGTLVGIATEEEARNQVKVRLEELEEQIKALAKQAESNRSERSRSLLMDRITALRRLKMLLEVWVSNADRETMANSRCGGCWQGAWKLPKVKFDNGRTVALLPSLFQSEVVGQGKCERLQIPLKAAWAVTIHKSQGMTLSAAYTKVAGSFAPGMAYVALSRVSSLAGLRLRTICADLECSGCEGCRCELSLEHMNADKQVAQFYSACRAFALAVAGFAAQLVSAGAHDLALRVRGCGPRGVLEVARTQAHSPYAGSSVVRTSAQAACIATEALGLHRCCNDWRDIAPVKSRYRAEDR